MRSASDRSPPEVDEGECPGPPVVAEVPRSDIVLLHTGPLHVAKDAPDLSSTLRDMRETPPNQMEGGAHARHLEGTPLCVLGDNTREVLPVMAAPTFIASTQPAETPDLELEKLLATDFFEMRHLIFI